MVMSGSDADALDALAHQMGGKSSKIQGVSKRLGREIHGSPWHGRNADRFRRDWDGEYRRSLAEAASFLQQAGEVLHRNAREQRDASGIAQPGSAWQRFKDAFKRVKDLWKILPYQIKDLIAILKFAYKAWNLLAKATLLGKILAPIGLFLDAKDLIFDHEFSGAFNYLESFSDFLRVAAGVAFIVSWFTPIGPIVTAIAFAAIGASLIIDQGMNYWNKGGGREVWRSTQPRVNKAFKNALSAPKSAPVSASMKSNWNTPSPTGRMQFSPSLPGSRMRDAGC
jgi:hypothetical protein